MGRLKGTFGKVATKDVKIVSSMLLALNDREKFSHLINILSLRLDHF